MPSSTQGLLPSHSPVQRAAIGSIGQAWAFYGARAAEDVAGMYGWLLSSAVFVVPMPEGLGWLQLSWLHCPVPSSQSHSHYLSHMIIWRQYYRKLISGGERISVSSLNNCIYTIYLLFVTHEKSGRKLHWGPNIFTYWGLYDIHFNSLKYETKGREMKITPSFKLHKSSACTCLKLCCDKTSTDTKKHCNEIKQWRWNIRAWVTINNPLKYSMWCMPPQLPPH